MKKVLILEDEVNIRSFVVINLTRAGYYAIEAGTGQEALDRLAENPDIGVAILDIMLPDVDGFQILKQIREKEYCRSLEEYQGNLLLVGIDYDKKTKEHQCVIEKYRK